MTLEKQLVALLSACGLKIATAESCTGGLVAGKITEVAGCSSVFLGGVVGYAYDVKEKVLGVSGALLAEKGAVCAEVAEQMALGVRTLTGADVSVATTGLAGPGPGEGGKPAGLVYIAASCGKKTVVSENHFAGTREEVRAQAVEKALKMAVKLIVELIKES